MSKKTTRIAIINKDKCKPTKCNFECGLICPVNRQKKECIRIIDIEDMGKKKKIANIVEDACIGCGLCTKSASNGGCPFGAIMIVNIPTELQPDIVNRYGQNGFRLYRMPILKQGKIMGLIGQNGIGKSTVVQILSDKIKPNFEIFETNALSNDEIVNKFKGNEMHKYMQKLYNNEFKISIKPQHVDSLIPYFKSKGFDYTVSRYIQLKCGETKEDEKMKQFDWYMTVITTLELDGIMESKVNTLSGGELQRLLCAIALLTEANVYIFDEPTNYLDIKQRLNIAKLIKMLASEDKYIAVIEHDLSILDYISDYISILYGQPSAYGIVSQPLSTANGINIYFDGYIPGENMRFRQYEYNNISLNSYEGEGMKFNNSSLKYNETSISFPSFRLTINAGIFPTEGSISVVMGKNGTGKTTFINYIANEMREVISHKPQYLSVDQFKSPNGTYPTVLEFLMNTIRDSYINELFRSDVLKPMAIENIADRCLNELSGGEMQRFWITYCLGKNAHIYLIDEPSACLDIEQRVIVTKVIKRFIMHNKKVAFVVEHDMMMAVALGCEVNSKAIIVDEMETIIENDKQIRRCQSFPPTNFDVGINNFLKILGVTFHTQSYGKHSRPRINKFGSMKDREQKSRGMYYE